MYADLPLLIAQTSSSSGLPWWAWLGLAGIISGSICGIVSSLLTHRERMAMIRMGIHPDAKPDENAKPPHPEGAEIWE